MAALLAVLLLVAFFPALGYQGAPAPPSIRSDKRVNIVYQSGIPSDIYGRVQAAGGSVIKLNQDLKLVVAENTSSVSQSTFMSNMAAYGDTSIVAADLRGQLLFDPNDTYYVSGKQWGAQHVHANTAWTTTVGSKDVSIGIIDTGVFCLHEDLSANCDTTHSTSVGDADGHGTAVASVAAAVSNNDKGIAGMSQSNIVALAIPCSASCLNEVWLSDVSIAIEQAVILSSVINLTVINLSLAFYWNCGDSPPVATECGLLKLAIDNAYGAGMLIVAGAGNRDCQPLGYPAAFSNVLAVGAITPQNTRWVSQGGFGSACGDQLDLVAPGSGIVSAVPVRTLGVCEEDPGAVTDPPYCNITGTSFAAPHVAGAAALIWSKCRSLGRDTLSSLLVNNAEDLGLPAREQGRGMLRVDWALNAALSRPECAQ